MFQMLLLILLIINLCWAKTYFNEKSSFVFTKKNDIEYEEH